MSNHTHECKWCSSRYPGPTLLVEGEDEHGRPRAECACAVKDECPGCSEHGACESCGKSPAGDERNLFLCQDCADTWIDNYEPPEPDLNGVSAGERMSEAYATDRRLR